ncbi:hypothetical protein MASR2M18_16940 [Ignavibacteria bacterium]|nr:DUF1573 domain-containing protein [Bacteroidota bacterium]MCZ2102420.1 DUF1573 domain-containing protein [Chitinophagales bacterium]
MKKIIVASLAVLFFAAVGAFAQPKLEIVGGDTYNWGKVNGAQSPLKAVVEVKNTGTGILNIKEVKPGCGCTGTVLDKKELGPGEIGKIDVSLNLSGVNGPLTKNISIMSNDPNNPTKVLYLKAEVARAITMSPTQYLVYNSLAVGQRSEAKITIKNNSTTDVTLSEPQASEGLVVNIKPSVVIKAGTEFELVAQYTPKAKGYFNGNVKIKTSNPEFQMLDIPAYGNVIESNSPVFVPKQN